MVVRRGSQVHQVPHTGLPHSAPSTIVRPVNSTPTSAAAAARRSQRVRDVIR